MNDADLLVGLSDGELEALAESMLAPVAQTRLNDLLARSKAQTLVPTEGAELDQLLERVDQLTVLKTRARYTLSQKAATSPT